MELKRINLKYWETQSNITCWLWTTRGFETIPPVRETYLRDTNRVLYLFKNVCNVSVLNRNITARKINRSWRNRTMPIQKVRRSNPDGDCIEIWAMVINLNFCSQVNRPLIWKYTPSEPGDYRVQNANRNLRYKYVIKSRLIASLHDFYA
jgi:hypothetical protein